MSTTQTHANDHDHDHGHHGHDDGGHGSFKSYVTGFILAVILTAIPFWLVLGKVFDKSSTTGLVLLTLGAVQIVVHMIYFLHMSTRAEGGWSMLALLFTVMVVVIMMSGSVWVMFHLNENMMPGMMTESTMETRPESIAVPAPVPAASEVKPMDNMQKMP